MTQEKGWGEGMASELFNRIFDSGVGSCQGTCDCGRVHFDIYNTWDWEEGELELLKERAETDERYIAHDCGIGFVEIDGRTFVYGCLCNTVDKYELFIKEHAAEIAKFLNELSKEKQEEANNIQVRTSEDTR